MEEFGDVHLVDEDVAYDRAMERMQLLRLMARLPARQQEILRLRFVEGRNQRDIGAALGLSQVHVSRLVKKSLDALRGAVEPASQQEMSCSA